MDFTSIFSGVENARAMGGFASRLGIGQHTVLLKRFNVKDSQKGKGKYIEAEFYVLESAGSGAATPGDSKGWAWFINSPGFAGQYEESRLKAFIEVVAKSIGASDKISVIGGQLASEAQLGRGLMLKCSVTAQTRPDGALKQNAAGVTYTDISWTPVSQSLEDIAKARALLGEQAPAGQPASQPVAGGLGQDAAPAVTQPTQNPATPAAGNSMSTLLASLRKDK